VPCRSAGRRTALPGLLLLAALAGCSGVPYAPGPSVVPSPSPAPTPPAATRVASPAPEDPATGPVDGPVVELHGTLVSDDGQQAQLAAHLQLGDLGPPQRGEEDRGSRRLAVRGTVTLTNPTDRIDVPAASVQVVLQAGYRTTSPACRALPPPDGTTWGRYCWYLLAATTPYGEHLDLVALQPGEQRVRALMSARGPGRLRVAGTDRQRVEAALRRPLVVVAVTAPVTHAGMRVRSGCGSAAAVVGPSGAAPPARAALVQNAVVASSTTIACRDVRYVGP